MFCRPVGLQTVSVLNCFSYTKYIIELQFNISVTVTQSTPTVLQSDTRLPTFLLLLLKFVVFCIKTGFYCNICNFLLTM